MAAADRILNTQQLGRFINNLWQHQQNNMFCDFTLTTNNTSIECHKLVLSSASSYFSQLLCDSEHKTDTIDVTPLPEHILRTVVAFMYNSEYVIDDDNVIKLLKFSRTWNLDILAMLCVAYMNDNCNINNACRFYNFALETVIQTKSQLLNKFIREHFTSLHESGQLSELSLRNFNTIIEHDEINVKNEDVIFNSAEQIINQQTSVEDINRCLELIRFPHASGDFLVKVILNHPLMKIPPRNKYVSEALLYQINKTSTPEVKPPRYWERSEMYYIGTNHFMYQIAFRGGNNDCVKVMNIPEWVDNCSAVASYKERVVIAGGENRGTGDKRALLLDMPNIKRTRTQLPDLPEPCYNASVVLSDNDVYVVGGYNHNRGSLKSVYHLSLGSDAWQTKKPMSHAVSSSLVIQHQQYIYVLGEMTNNRAQSSVSQYNIEDDTWKQCSRMPVGCNSNVAGVVVHEDRIKVITVDKCLMYADDTDTWTVKQYHKIGDAVNVFVAGGHILAAVQNGRKSNVRSTSAFTFGGTCTSGTYSMLSYDCVDNVWKTVHERIDNAWETKLFC